MWTFESRGREVTFDPRILEDTAGSLSVSTRTPATAEGTTVSVLRRSARLSYRSTAGPPASRGRPCTRSDAAVARCPVTDGDFTTRLPTPAVTTTTTASPGVTTAAQSDSVTVDLGRARDVPLVVVRGCQCEVEGSLDGQSWTPLGRSTGFTAVVPARTGAARHVRLTGLLTDVREVSVWDTAPSAPPPAPSIEAPPATAQPLTPPPPGTPGPSRWGPALLALAALLAAAVAVAAAATRDPR